MVSKERSCLVLWRLGYKPRPRCRDFHPCSRGLRRGRKSLAAPSGQSLMPNCFFSKADRFFALRISASVRKRSRSRLKFLVLSTSPFIDEKKAPAPPTRRTDATVSTRLRLLPAASVTALPSAAFALFSAASFAAALLRAA